MNLEPSFLLGIVTALAACGGAYAAIRADLGRLHERASQALESAQRAHERIDHLRRAGDQ